ncbi:MAG: hypothetical protein ABIT37_07100 [Luteolibacter sp.]
MKSCLGLLFALFLFIAVIGGGAMIWYLSSSAEFSRTAAPASTPAKGAPPVAIPVRPAPPHAKPVR